MKLTMLKKTGEDTTARSIFAKPLVDNASGDPASTIAEAQVASVTLTREGNSGYAAALPLQIPDGDPNHPLRTLTKISMSSESSSSKNGTRRLLLRVSMPYFSLDPNAFASGARQLSTSRSTKTMTAHVVITVPREFEQDIRGMYTGDAGTIAADAQLAGLLDLLRYMLGGSGTGLVASDLILGTTDQGAGAVSYVGYGYRTPTQLANDIEGYTGQYGLVLPESGQMTKSGSNPLTRSILGLPPLDENDVIGLTTNPQFSFSWDVPV